jgi:hypothetical protein
MYASGMPDTREIKQVMGAYTVQYTDAARVQIEDMDDALCDAIQNKIRMVAAVDPYAHGTPTGQMRDRRHVVIDGMSVGFWVSTPVKVMTVFELRKSEFPQWSPRPEAFGRSGRG